MNLFLSTRRLTDCKEDHLTEFLASALDMDEGFRRAYESTVLHCYGSQKGWESVEIKAITTQSDYPDAGCRPDMVLTLAGGHMIVCEHKLDAPETLGRSASTEEQCVPVRQLERYLELRGVHGLAYFRSWWQAPDDVVLSNARYIRPSSGREHFLWSDLYEPLIRGSSLLSHWLREGFATLGFTPPHPLVGELEDPDKAIRMRSRENLKKLWDPARTRLRLMGWEVESGSICQLYIKSNANSNAEMIYVSPYEPGGRVLLVRVTPRYTEKIGGMVALLQSTSEAAASLSQVELVDVSRVGGTRTVIDVKIPFNRLLDGSTEVSEIENKLSDYVCAIAERSSKD